MPEAPRHTQDTWIPNGPNGPNGTDTAPAGPASADPGHEAATLGRKTEAGRRAGTSPSRGGADSTVGFGESDAPRRSGADGTDTAHGSGTGTGPAGTESPLVAAHPRTGEDTSAHAADGASAHHGRPGSESRLLADDTCDRLSAQLRQAVAGFVDRPRDAVEEADLVLREITERLTDALTERRRTLAQNWKTPASGDPRKGDTAPAADTEQLRLALRDYRELAERLLGV
ncbi:hypothetical protein ACFSUJ_09840 [Streptomyces lusitanus]|uniref:Uncharacterized protein n=1 Tax=Streptomyces lusitanus TaxID=68232 RepID=A0ABU3JIS8_9ACTN|nr:hypothetical protein [Streptomyces lusitanus]